MNVRGHLSPSLARSPGQVGPAFEMKFLIGEDLARRLTERALRHWQRDPYADPALDGAYRTTTIYCDTPDLTMFRREPGYANRKFRLRRYGANSRIYLERKTKWGERVHKRRSSILSALALVRDLNRCEGVQNVELRQQVNSKWGNQVMEEWKARFLHKMLEAKGASLFMYRQRRVHLFKEPCHEHPATARNP